MQGNENINQRTLLNFPLVENVHQVSCIERFSTEFLADKTDSCDEVSAGREGWLVVCRLPVIGGLRPDFTKHDKRKIFEI